jgi:hypothetical protein
MRIVSKHQLLLGVVSLIGVTVALYGCKNFLADSAAPQGTLNEATLATATGVEGTLIGAYRALDCTAQSAQPGLRGQRLGVGTIAAGDAYKGSTQPISRRSTISRATTGVRRTPKRTWM